MLSTMGRPKEHNAATAASLLEAAERAIEDSGVDALSVRGVAADVGVSTRAVYSVFGSREALVAALGVRAFDLLGEAVSAVPTSDDPIADLINAGLEFRRFAIDHPSLFVLGVQRTAPLPEELWVQVRTASGRALDLLEDRVARIQAAGLIGSRTVHAAALEFHAYCEGMAALELRGTIPRDERPIAQLWADGLSALLHGFRAT
jgi:AcrR family transcriptional regulator